MGLERHRRPAPSPPVSHIMVLALPVDTEVGWTGEEEIKISNIQKIKGLKEGGRRRRRRRKRRRH